MYANSVDKIVYHQISGHDSCYQMCPKYVTLEIGVLGLSVRLIVNYRILYAYS